MTAEEQIEAAADAVSSALRFAATEPHGDLALSADRAALIAVRALIVIGWRPAALSQPSNEGDNHDAG